MVKATTTVSRRESQQLERLLAEIRACRICEEHLPLGPRPVVVASASARVLVAGQAPGTKVHESGIPWDDASGDRRQDAADAPLASTIEHGLH